MYNNVHCTDSQYESQGLNGSAKLNAIQRDVDDDVRLVWLKIGKHPSFCQWFMHAIYHKLGMMLSIIYNNNNNNARRQEDLLHYIGRNIRERVHKLNMKYECKVVVQIDFRWGDTVVLKVKNSQWFQSTHSLSVLSVFTCGTQVLYAMRKGQRKCYHSSKLLDIMTSLSCFHSV
jgi:hypothetical protein